MKELLLNGQRVLAAAAVEQVVQVAHVQEEEVVITAVKKVTCQENVHVHLLRVQVVALAVVVEEVASNAVKKDILQEIVQILLLLMVAVALHMSVEETIMVLRILEEVHVVMMIEGKEALVATMIEETEVLAVMMTEDMPKTVAHQDMIATIEIVHLTEETAVTCQMEIETGN